MPYQDGKYVAPTWSNNAPPPINASELQAIADKCEDTWDKDETISSETAAIYGLSEGYTPDKAFRAISTNFNRTINVTVTLDGEPIEGVTVFGITPLSGEGNCVTDSSGKTSGTTGVDTVTISTGEFVDIVGGKASKIVETGGALSTDATLEMTSVPTFKKQYTSSTTLKLIRSSVNYFLVGGGGSGGANTYYGKMAACGGGGGYTKSGSIDISNQTLSITVGSGGNSVTFSTQQEYGSGNGGGASKISSGSTTISANGGGGGTARRDSSAQGVNGASGGSGSGAAAANEYDVQVGQPGSNGGNGTAPSNMTSVGILRGGEGQGTTTQFDGITYSTAGGSAAYTNSNGLGSRISGTGRFGSSGVSGSQYGDGGGACIHTGGTVTSGAGKQGCVWIYW